MIRPNKHSHPDRTIVNVALQLGCKLKRERLISYDDLRNYTKGLVAGGDVLFLPSLNFLYLLGLIEYRPKTDAVEYVGSNETI